MFKGPKLGDQEIIEKVIAKAIDGGWKLEGFNIIYVRAEFKPGHLPIYLETDEIHSWVDDGITHKENTGHALSTESVIFDHDFAKALWGEEVEYAFKQYAEKNILVRTEAGRFIAWQYHLQQLVIADDIFKYLEANI